MGERKQEIESSAMVGVHLDLKYHVANKKFLLEWVRRLPRYGINTLLIEYEDAFPYRKYPFIVSPDAFTPETLREFLAEVRNLGLQPIPMVPTYAHLEFALAHPELASLRERPDIHAKVCARKPEAVRFVKDLIENVLEFHGEDSFIHLGADEVWHTEWCPECTERVARMGLAQMWGEHMKPLLELVVAAGKRPIVFDDVFWKQPETIVQARLPRETIINAWNYNVTGVTSSESAGDSLDMGGAVGVLKQVDAYRLAGYDCIGSPCCNFGQLFPQHSHCLNNTAVWVRKARATGSLGIINTAWSVFHVPLQTFDLQIAATGRMMNEANAAVDEVWQEQWLKNEFGASAKGVPGALEVLGALWEIPMREYGRPFTPLPYGYMNMVLHFPGRHKDRQRFGPYPLDWSTVDFGAVYQKGVAVAKSPANQPAVSKGLDARLAAFPSAVAVLDAFMSSATNRKEDAGMLATLARFKWISLRVFAYLVRGEDDCGTLKGELTEIEQPLRIALGRAWEPVGCSRLMKAFYEPLMKALAGNF